MQMDIPKRPGGDYLTADEIGSFGAIDPSEYRRDTPPGEVPLCAYCGSKTEMAAYTHRDVSWPACCGKDGCLDQWEPIGRQSQNP